MTLKTSQRHSHESLCRFFFFPLGTLPDLEKLVPNEEQKECNCCQENASVTTHPRTSQWGFSLQILLQAHLKSMIRNNSDSIFLQTSIPHCQDWGSPFKACCGCQGRNEHMERNREVQLTSVTFSVGESFAPGKDVQIGLGCVFSSGF